MGLTSLLFSVNSGFQVCSMDYPISFQRCQNIISHPICSSIRWLATLHQEMESKVPVPDGDIKGSWITSSPKPTKSTATYGTTSSEKHIKPLHGLMRGGHMEVGRRGWDTIFKSILPPVQWPTQSPTIRREIKTPSFSLKSEESEPNKWHLNF